MWNVLTCGDKRLGLSGMMGDRTDRGDVAQSVKCRGSVTLASLVIRCSRAANQLLFALARSADLQK